MTLFRMEKTQMRRINEKKAKKICQTSAPSQALVRVCSLAITMTIGLKKSQAPQGLIQLYPRRS